MTTTNNYYRRVLLAGITLLLFYYLNEIIEDAIDILAFFLALPILIFFVVAFIQCIINQNKKGIWIGIAVISVMLCTEALDAEIFKSEKIFGASTVGDISANLTLRIDNTFDFISYGITQKRKYKGTFLRKNDRIILKNTIYLDGMPIDSFCIDHEKVFCTFNKDGTPDTSYFLSGSYYPR